MKKATMHDVAEMAGVSQASVSLILNNSNKISFSKETKERVFAAAEALGYKLPARKREPELKNRRIILLLVPTLENLYYTELIQYVENYADSLGYRVLICNTFRRPELEKYYLDHFFGEQAAGIIYSFQPAYPKLAEQFTEQMPVVLLGEKDEELSICSIEPSNVAAGGILLEHLYQLGHRRFACFTSDIKRTSPAFTQRLEGIRRQLDSREDICSLDIFAEDPEKLPLDMTDEVPREYEAGRFLVADFLRQQDEGFARKDITALICVNDMIALGVLNELALRSIPVPERYSVVSFDNTFGSRITNPGLTTIAHHLRRRCHSAVDMIIEDLHKQHKSGKTPFLNKIEYTPQLIIRGSAGPAARL